MLSFPRKTLSKPWLASFLWSGRQARCGSLGLLIGTLVSAPAWADLSDTLHPFASLGYSYDDNLLRLPDATPGFNGPRADTTRQLQAGLSFERPVGRQLFSGQAKTSRVTFDHYRELDYNGKDMSAAWQWQFLENLDGHIGGAYTQTLTPFTDNHTSDRNLRVQRREYADGNWRFQARWQVHGSFSRDKYSYDLPSQRFNDRNEDVGEVGVDYLAASGSRIGLVSRQLKGAYLTARQVGSVTVDDGYTQKEVKAKIYWNFSGVTQVQVLAGVARREHNFYTARDSSGLDGRVTAFWNPTGKLHLTVAGWREYAAVENAVLSNSLNKGYSLNGIWDATAKVKLDGSVRSQRRTFDTIGGVALPFDASDNSRTTSLGVTYSPYRVVQLNASAFNERRTGSPYLGNGSYRANGVSISAVAQF